MSSGVLFINEETGNVSFATRVRKAMRKCSFCCSTQHKVDTCNDVRLIEFHTKLRRRRDSLRGLDRMDSMEYYRVFVKQFSHDLIKAYAIKHCQLAPRSTIEECASFITNKMFSREFDTEEQYEIELAVERERLLELPEYIAFRVTEPTPMPRQFMLTEDEASNMDPEFIAHYFRITGYTQGDLLSSKDRKYDITIKMKGGSKFRKELEKQRETEKEIEKEKEECPICYETLYQSEFITLNCKHEFCGDCLRQLLQSCNPHVDPSCAICRACIKSFEFEDRKVFDKVQHNLCSTLVPHPHAYPLMHPL